MANTLFLRLESPLQAWGEDSQWSERRTAPEPTKSGLVGLLACALGWDDDERIAGLTQRIRIGVRCDVPGTPAPLRDYHTVGGGYTFPQLLTAVGKPKLSRGKPHTEPTWRYYLCDASLLAAVRFADQYPVDDLAEAVQNPHWPIYLGRKCCIPTRPPFDGVGDYASLEEALLQHPALFFKNEDQPIDLAPRIIVECRAGEGVRRRDQLVSRTYRLFEPRYSREGRLPQPLQVTYLDAGG